MDVPHPVPSHDPQTIVVRGDVDLAVLTRLPHWLRTVFDPAGRRFRLDLTAVSFLDCAGLRALLAIEDHAGAAGGSVEATGVSPAVARLLELVDLPAGSSFLTASAPTASTPSSGASPPAGRDRPDRPPGPDEVFSRQPVWSSTTDERELVAACDAAVAELVEQLVARPAGDAAGPGTEMLRLHVLDLVRVAADRQALETIRRADLLLAKDDAQH